MRGFGGFLIFAGVVSALLHFTDVQLKILMWSEPMQPGFGVGLAAFGGIVVGICVAFEKAKQNRAQSQQPPFDQRSSGQQAPYGQPFAPPPGPQQYGQPQYGQQQFGQQQFGPPAGPPPVPAPQYGQPQPQYGQPPYGQAPNGRPLNYPGQTGQPIPPRG